MFLSFEYFILFYFTSFYFILYFILSAPHVQVSQTGLPNPSPRLVRWVASALFSQPLPQPQAKRMLILCVSVARSSNPSHRVCIHSISEAVKSPSALTFDTLKSKDRTLRCTSKTETRQPNSLSGLGHELSPSMSQHTTHAWYWFETGQPHFCAALC